MGSLEKAYERMRRDAWVVHAAKRGDSVRLIAKVVKLTPVGVYFILQKNDVWLSERGRGRNRVHRTTDRDGI